MKFRCFWSGHKLTKIIGKRKRISIAECEHCGDHVVTLLGHLVGTDWYKVKLNKQKDISWKL